MKISTRNRRIHNSIKENVYYTNMFSTIYDMYRDNGFYYFDCTKNTYHLLLGDYSTCEGLKEFDFIIEYLNKHPIKDIQRFRVCWYYWIRNPHNTAHCFRGKELYKF